MQKKIKHTLKKRKYIQNTRKNKKNRRVRNIVKTNRRKTKKQGGKVIGTGGYGCVFRPALPCKQGNDGQRPDNKVSKLMKKEHALKEMNENEVIDRIDPMFEFHLETPYTCELADKYNNLQYTPESEEDADKCKDLQYIMNHEPIVIQQEDGGMSLRDFIETYKVSAPNVKELMDMMKRCASLIRGLDIMSKNSISHFDIKSENIVYNPLTNKVRYIDFGIAGTYKDIISRTYKFNRIYPWYPLEVFFVYDDYKKLKIGKLFNTPLNIETLQLYKVYEIDWYIQRYIKSIFLTENDGTNMYSGIFNYIDTYVDLASKNTELKFKKDIVEKVDIFSLGIVFMQLWNKYLKTFYRYMTHEDLELFIHYKKFTREREFILKLYEIIYKMTKPLFIDRISVDELVTMYNDLLMSIPEYTIESSNTSSESSASTSSSESSSLSESSASSSWRNRIKGIFTRKKRT